MRRFFLDAAIVAVIIGIAVFVTRVAIFDWADAPATIRAYWMRTAIDRSGAAACFAFLSWLYLGQKHKKFSAILVVIIAVIFSRGNIKFLPVDAAGAVSPVSHSHKDRKQNKENKQWKLAKS